MEFRIRHTVWGIALAAVLCFGAVFALAPQDAYAGEQEMPPGFSIQSKQTIPPQYIKPKKAKQIALQHAGLKKKKCKAFSVDLGMRNGQPAYLVRFRRAKVQFTYSVSARDGDIISYSAYKRR